MKSEPIPSTSLELQRLPLRALHKKDAPDQPIEKPVVMTHHRMKAIRDELATITDGCEAVQRVLDQSEAVLRFDDLKDMPGFRQELTAELRAKLRRLADTLGSCLENFKRRI